MIISFIMRDLPSAPHGPTPPLSPRIDPHVMTSVRKALENIGDIHDLSLSGGACLERQGDQH